MIGFYDSGIGGVSILDEVLKINSKIPFIYLADTEVLPLGDKTINFIQDRIKLACEKLFSLGCEIVILSCNTASVNSIRHIQNVWLPNNYPKRQVLSITKPFTELVEEKFKHLKLERGLIFATQATYNSGFYQYEFLKNGFSGLEHIPCPGLADAIEKESIVEVRKLIQEYMYKYSIQVDKIKYILLACTHYKWITPEIQKNFKNASIIEPSKTCAEKIISYINHHPEYVISNNLESQFLVTGENNSLSKISSKLNYNFAINKIKII